MCFTEPQACAGSARTHPCDPVDVDGTVNLDVDQEGCLIGIGVPAAGCRADLLATSRRLRARRAGCTSAGLMEAFPVSHPAVDRVLRRAATATPGARA
ncbi:hypothetical protein LO771_21090 [Streptacidiphilus sp. ASG 303]|nr:hypothetical protein [Streptacidiphilus sp. ASG 303]